MESMANKTGKGRSNHATKVTETEAVVCVERPDGGNHWLINNARAETSCRFCKVSWGDLDEQINGPRH